MSDERPPNAAAPPEAEKSAPAVRAGRRPSRLAASAPRRAAHDEGEDWMLTYTDVVTLLIALFVMLLSYTIMNEEKYRRMANALSSAVRGPQAISIAPLPGAGSTLPGAPSPAAEPDDAKDDGGRSKAVADDLKKGIAGLGLADQVGVEVRKNQVQLDIKASVLFPTGQSELTGEGRRVLDKLAPVLKKGAYKISVEGHTDDVPIATERFPSNWELSAGRATTVVRHLIGEGVEPKRLQAVGHAEMRPVADNKADDGRQKNRRVNLRLTFEGDEK